MNKKGKKIIIFISFAVVFAIVLGVISSKPIISNKVDAPEAFVQKVRAQAQGVYSSRLPLLPVYVSIDGCTVDVVYYTIYYFSFGIVGMAYSQRDGYNIVKSLAGLK
ncbi:MAG: hypothetical protein GX061_01265 [Eubacteriaceae bacterium]|nr:hypothetical protein [Eubacteriaceae bacterium]